MINDFYILFWYLKRNSHDLQLEIDKFELFFISRFFLTLVNKLKYNKYSSFFTSCINYSLKFINLIKKEYSNFLINKCKRNCSFPCIFFLTF